MIDDRPLDARGGALAVAACGVIVACLFVMPVLRFNSLHSNFYDLGQYATYHHSIAFTGYWGAILRTHAHLYALPYAFIYRLAPGNLTLILIQTAVTVGAGAMYVAYWRRLKLPYPAMGALLYLLSISVWFSALFDFHYEHLIFPIVFGFFLIVDRSDRPVTQSLAVWVGLMLCLVKEIYPLSAAMLGLYLVIVKRWYVAGALLFAASIAYFLFVTSVAIPFFSSGANTGELWSAGFGHLGGTAIEILESVLKHPLTIAADILGTPRKLLYVAALFGALALLPLFRPLTLLPAAPVLGIALLSHNVNHYYLGHQYTIAVTVVALIAAAQALTAWSRVAQRRWIAAMMLGSVASLIAFGPAPISRLFWSRDIFNYHWSAYRPDAHDRRLNEAIEKFVPKGDAVAVSAQNAINSDRLSDRNMAFAFPQGVASPAGIQDQSGIGPNAPPRSVFADVVILDRRRPLSFGDDICRFDRMEVCRDDAFVARFESSLDMLKRDFEVLYDDDGIMIAKRRGPPAGSSD